MNGTDRAEEPVRAAYAALAAYDTDALLAVLDPWIEWVCTEGGPCGGTAVGALDVLDAVLVPAAADWARLDVRPERVLSVGGTVVALGSYLATARGTGATVAARFVHVWDVRDGPIVRVETVADSALLNRALLVGPGAARR